VVLWAIAKKGKSEPVVRRGGEVLKGGGRSFLIKEHCAGQNLKENQKKGKGKLGSSRSHSGEKKAWRVKEPKEENVRWGTGGVVQWKKSKICLVLLGSKVNKRGEGETLLAINTEEKEKGEATEKGGLFFTDVFEHPGHRVFAAVKDLGGGGKGAQVRAI